MDAIKLINSQGEETLYDTRKIVGSLERVGASEAMIRDILQEIESGLQELGDVAHTKNIYRLAFRALRQRARHLAARYSLKRAIQELGPSGYPFEVLVSELFAYQGYRTEVGKLMAGNCVEHEVDVLARKGEVVRFAECKFHSDFSRKNDIKVALYYNARFHDLAKGWRKQHKEKPGEQEGWLFTNTHFSEDAVQYGNCVGLHLVGWSYPDNGSLKQRIDLAGVHPLTCLTTLSRKEKSALLERDLVLARHLLDRKSFLSELGLSQRRISKVTSEAEKLIHREGS